MKNVPALPLRTIAVAFLLIVSAAEFVVRGPLRINNSMDWNDFISPYIQSKAWVQGQDPYRSPNVVRLWPSGTHMPSFVLRESVDNALVEHRGIPSPYPPTTFVVLAPLSLLPWKFALWVWISISLAALAATLIAVANMSGIRFSAPSGLLFLALCLGLAPIHTGLATANPAIVGIALSVVALFFAEQHWDGLAGLLIAGSICLKPPIGLCFLLFYLVSRRWQVVVTASGAALAVAFVAIGRMWLADLPWLASYQLLTQHMFAPGAINDFTSANAVWFQLVNLQGPLDMIFGDPGVATTVGLCVGIVLLILWTFLTLSARNRGDELLAVSVLAVLSFLPVYHRFYDTALLVLPLAWAFSPRNEASLRIRCFTVVLIIPFLIPGAAFLNQLSSRLPHSAVDSHWWNALVIAHEAWFLLLLSILLLYAMWRLNKRPSLVAQPASQPA
jgi:hypothetical protein